MRQRFNPLLDEPPVVADIGGEPVRIETDYRVVLSYLRLLREDISDEEKAILGLNLFCPLEKITDITEFAKYIDWFIRLGEEPPEHGKEKPVFDILQDSDKIFAAFYQVYRIDLRHVRMHWWIFYTLLMNLPKDTKLADIVELRGRKVEKWMDAQARIELARAQNYYRLDEPSGDIMADVFTMLAGIAQ
jgi:hypothetical protein